MIKAGIHGRIAMQTVDLFADVAQAWSDSEETIKKFQESIFEKRENVQIEEKKEVSDMSDQTGNSPILDGMGTGGSNTTVE